MVSWAIPGLGMFNESYYIFSVGNVKPIWAEQYPECWKVRLILSLAVIQPPGSGRAAARPQTCDWEPAELGFECPASRPVTPIQSALHSWRRVGRQNGASYILGF